jgi:copper chaperone CopZ
MKLARSILLAAAIATPLSAQALRPVPRSAPVAEVLAADTQRVALHVEGMTCGGCAISTRVVLKRLDGVRTAEVSYEDRRALVTYDRSRVTPQQMIAALKEKLGYTARVVEAGAR